MRKTVIKRKLASQQGASLPLALLLFLICALVTAVVLSASTAAAGRQAQLAQMDQRYYSVTSAAQLMQDELQDKAVFVRSVQTRSDVVTVTYEANGNTQRTVAEGEPSDYTFAVATLTREQVARGEVPADDAYTVVASGTEASTVAVSSLTLPELVAVYQLLGGYTTSFNPAAAWQHALFQNDNEFSLGSYDLAPTVTSAPQGVSTSDVQRNLAATVSMLSNAGGGVQFNISSNRSADDTTDSYALTVDCTESVIAHETASEQVTNVSYTSSSNSRIETIMKTTTRAACITWPSAKTYKTGEGA